MNKTQMNKMTAVEAKNVRAEIRAEIRSLKEKSGKTFCEFVPIEKYVKRLKGQCWSLIARIRNIEEEHKEKKAVRLRWVLGQVLAELEVAKQEYEICKRNLDEVRSLLKQKKMELSDVYLTREEEAELIEIIQNKSLSEKKRNRAMRTLYGYLERLIAKIYFEQVAGRYNYAISYNDASPVIYEEFVNAVLAYENSGKKFMSYFTKYLAHIELRDHIRYKDAAEKNVLRNGFYKAKSSTKYSKNSEDDENKRIVGLRNYVEACFEFDGVETDRAEVASRFVDAICKNVDVNTKEILEYKLLGWSNDKIGKKMGCSAENIRLKLVNLPNITISFGLDRESIFETLNNCGRSYAVPSLYKNAAQICLVLSKALAQKRAGAFFYPLVFLSVRVLYKHGRRSRNKCFIQTHLFFCQFKSYIKQDQQVSRACRSFQTYGK